MFPATEPLDPDRDCAHAKLSFRLVVDQDPLVVRKQLDDYVATAAVDGVHVTVQWFTDGVRPCLTPLDHPALEATTRAMARAFDREVLYTREGGSGPRGVSNSHAIVR